MGLGGPKDDVIGFLCKSDDILDEIYVPTCTVGEAFSKKKHQICTENL